MIMETLQLLETAESNIRLDYFPSPMAAFIFRAWELVPIEEIAAVLGADETAVREIADRMGLGEQPDTADWRVKGYITVIKRFWHILPYEQILALLHWDENRLAFVLKEDDFLWLKLGGFKPSCQPVVYREPTPEEWRAMDRIGQIMRGAFPKEEQLPRRKPFDFFSAEFLLKKNTPHPIVSDGWVVADLTGWPDAAVHIEDFIHLFKQIWGVRLVKGAAREKNCISLRPSPIPLPEEAHRIEVSAEMISVEASGTEGLMRAMQFLAQAETLPLGRTEREPRFRTRMIYSFCGLYANVLDEDSKISYPDALLHRYSLLGINAIWLQGVLYKLQPYPFSPDLSDGWEKRLENLQNLVARAKRFGIKVYVYMNEPRAMPLTFFERYPELKGHEESGMASLCVSEPRVLDYVAQAVEALCRAVPDLGGFFLITMSENLTHCYSHLCPSSPDTNCPRCRNREALDVMTSVIKTFADAVEKAGTHAQLLIWTWGWEQAFLRPESIQKTFDALPPGLTIMTVSETNVPFTIGGVSGRVVDYSMSVLGPGETALDIWREAKAHGFETAAKIQVNTTWECSTVPALPVYGLVREHLNGICEAGVENLLMSWTLGGYPSENIRIASESFFKSSRGPAPLEYEGRESVEQAAALFSQAFQEFPFDCQTLYYGPQNGGPSNPLFEKPTGMTATMTGFAYDSLDLWRSIYPAETFLLQLQRLSEKWREGLKLLDKSDSSEFADFARAGYATFRSSYNQAKYILLREEPEANREELLSLLDEEIDLARMTAEIMSRNPSLGYEAANHYYYTRGMMMEKVVNCAYLAEKLKEGV